MPSRQALAKGLKRAGALLFIGVVERLLFTRIAALPRRIAKASMRDALARMEAEFDAPLYLRQFRNAVRRRRASRAPALHYALLGWREHRAPNAHFDPAFYRRVTPTLRGSEEPFDHFIRIGRGIGAAPNETAEAQRLRGAPVSSSRRMLVLHHGRGGGSGLLLTLYERMLVSQGITPIRLRPLTRTTPSLFVAEDETDCPQILDLASGQTLVDVARRVRAASILVNHVVDMPGEITSWIASAARELGVPYDVILHDYFPVCPRVNLIDASGRFCGVGAAEKCRACIASGGSEAGAVDIADWRARFADFLGGARDVLSPSEDLQLRLQPHLSRAVSIWRPEKDEAAPELRSRPLEGDEPLNIAIIGGLTPAKGSEAVITLAKAIRDRNAPVTLYLIGSSANDRRLRDAGVTILGRYREDDLGAQLDVVKPHLAFIPSIWPETWSFVLSHALRAGLPTVAFDIGAPAERLRRLGRGDDLIPLAFANDPERLLAFFLRLRERFR